MDFEKGKYSIAYKMLLDFARSFCNTPDSRNHNVSHTAFKGEYTIFAFDMSKFEVDLKLTAIDVRVEMEFEKETEAKLIAYAVLIRDNIFVVNSFNNLVTREL